MIIDVFIYIYRLYTIVCIFFGTQLGPGVEWATVCSLGMGGVSNVSVICDSTLQFVSHYPCKMEDWIALCVWACIQFMLTVFELVWLLLHCTLLIYVYSTCKYGCIDFVLWKLFCMIFIFEVTVCDVHTRYVPFSHIFI